MTLRAIICYLFGHRWPELSMDERMPRRPACLRCGKAMTYSDLINNG